MQNTKHTRADGQYKQSAGGKMLVSVTAVTYTELYLLHCVTLYVLKMQFSSSFKIICSEFCWEVEIYALFHKICSKGKQGN